jgi:hypothetical protein
MKKAEMLAELILSLCEGCLVYRVCSMPCPELYIELRNRNVIVPSSFPNPVGLGHTVSRIVKEWRQHDQRRFNQMEEGVR